MNEKRKNNDDVYRMLSESGDLTGPCGDTMKISLNIKDDRIDDAKIQVLGCPGAVASGCAVVKLAKGRSLEDASKIDMELLYKDLEKLPDKKIHCARLALKTLQKALEEYEQKSQQKASNVSGVSN
ncbi:MAG: iron-sulfur cluster assembly scaffold protein [Deltaproteobacteria bacterium]|nr:iron-sulfur cluster assembly scaffold protein [Deltaproteobacteria bacterium]